MHKKFENKSITVISMPQNQRFKIILYLSIPYSAETNNLNIVYKVLFQWDGEFYFACIFH